MKALFINKDGSIRIDNPTTDRDGAPSDRVTFAKVLPLETYFDRDTKIPPWVPQYQAYYKMGQVLDYVIYAEE